MKYYVKNTNLLSLTGKDVIDLIDRLSSNDIKNLTPGEYRKTILLTEKGRIVDLITIFNTGEKYIVEAAEGKLVKEYFDKYIFLEDVKITEEKNFKKIIIFDYDEKDIENFDTVRNKKFIQLHDKDECIIYKDDFIINTLNIICDAKNIENMILKLENAEKISDSEFERMRIENAIPGKELNEQINPLECNLEEFISFSKGCYIGQEVIARLDAQVKKPKQLVKIKSNEQFEEADKIFTEDGKEAGFISSAIGSNGNTIGLGFIRSMFLDFEKNYFVEKNNNKILINIAPSVMMPEQNKL